MSRSPRRMREHREIASAGALAQGPGNVRSTCARVSGDQLVVSGRPTGTRHAGQSTVAVCRSGDHLTGERGLVSCPRPIKHDAHRAAILSSSHSW